MTTLCSLVEQDIGLGAVPALAARPLCGTALAWRKLVPAVHRTTSLAPRASRSLTPAATAVVTALLAQLEGLRDPGIELLTNRAFLSLRSWLQRAA